MEEEMTRQFDELEVKSELIVQDLLHSDLVLMEYEAELEERDRDRKEDENNELMSSINNGAFDTNVKVCHMT